MEPQQMIIKDLFKQVSLISYTMHKYIYTNASVFIKLVAQVQPELQDYLQFS